MSMPIPPWRKSDVFNHRYNQRLNDAVNAARFADGGGDNPADGIEIEQTPTGLALTDRRPRIFTNIVYGKVADAGPDDEPDFTSGNQYWVRRRKLKAIAGETVGTGDDAVKTRSVEFEDDDAPDGDKVATGDGDELRDDTIIVAVDPFGGGRRDYSKDQEIVMVAVAARSPVFADDGEDISGTETAYIIIGLREETVWAVLGAFTNSITVGDGSAGTYYRERRYSWSRIVGYQQDEDDGGVGNDAGQFDGTGGTVDENYAVYHFDGSPQFEGMTPEPHLTGRAVLLRRIWREERFYTPHDDAYEIRRVRAWAIVEPPTPSCQCIKTGATYDAASGTQQGFRQFNVFTGDSGIYAPPSSSDKAACAAAALGGGSVEVLLVNGWPDPFKKLPSNLYVDATLCFITSDNVQVYRCCVPGITTGNALSAVDFGAESTTDTTVVKPLT